MNRALLQQAEIGVDGRVRLAGRRAKHILSVLHGSVGQTVRIGVLNGPRGTGTIDEATAGGVCLRCALDDPAPPRPRVDLLLAMPRPKVMKRLWAAVASMGVDRIVIVNAEKVERYYFDTHWLEPGRYEPLLVEGLEQSGDTQLPQVLVRRRLKPFVEDELDVLFPAGERWMGRVPGDGGGKRSGRHMKHPERILVAVGPEGGWTDWEQDLLGSHGFKAVSLGWRTLRSDTACVALLALAGRKMAETD